MKIKTIRIDSFGCMREKTFSLKDGLNVFYGKNESGKTTIMKMIRRTLSPSNAKIRYPEKSTTDAGSVVSEEDGITYETILNSKKGENDYPPSIRNIDPSVYRNIFAMTASDLINMSSFADKKVNTNFLTIPGGENVPATIKAIDEKMNSLIGKGNRSQSELSLLNNDIVSTETRISELKSKAESYSTLKEERDKYQSELDEINNKNIMSMKFNEECDRMNSLKPTYKRIDELKSEIDVLSKNKVASSDDVSRYKELKERCASRKSSFNALDETRKDCIKRLNTKSETEIRALYPEIKDVINEKQRYDNTPFMIDVPDTIEYEKRDKKPFLLALILMAVGIVPVVMKINGGLAITACMEIIGIIVIAASLLKKPKEIHVKHEPEPDNWHSEYEARVKDLSVKCGFSHISTSSDVEKLRGLESILSALDMSFDNWNESRFKMNEAEKELLSFLSEFNGENGYLLAVDNARILEKKRESIATLSKTISDSGFDPEIEPQFSEKIEIDLSIKDEISKKIGSLSKEMANVMDTDELEKLIDRLARLKAKKERILREGIVLAISLDVIDNACTELYSSVQPDVLVSANRCLSAMTSERYTIDRDPRNESLAISDGICSKTDKKWSSGLNAQVLLSLKLAVAKEMSEGNIPVILDDVLLTFDTDRKVGACNALNDLSKDMQILMFTCDDRTRDICSNIEGVNVITL